MMTTFIKIYYLIWLFVIVLIITDQYDIFLSIACVTTNGVLCSHPLCFDRGCPNNAVTESEVKRLFAIFITTREGQEMEKDTQHRGTFTTHGKRRKVQVFEVVFICFHFQNP